ncbi:TPA: alcohol dehydrogenase catalytic domain-containing protein [Burkholderia cepacia]|nr:alcohol dehydrogenase catalytic domain-containing protein [Burkholderia cepacia]
MTALVFEGTGEMALRDIPTPPLLEGEAIIRVDAVGICGTDLDIYHGHNAEKLMGTVLGHEFAGTVIASSNEAELARGVRVAVNPRSPCGVCEFCRQGRDNLCVDRGCVAFTRPGAFAEYVAFPLASAIPVPANLSCTHAALAEPAATVLNALTRAERILQMSLLHSDVLVIGGGAIGMLTAAYLTQRGCKSVVVAETNALRRKTIDRHIGCSVIDPRIETGVVAAFDLIVDAVGSGATRKAAVAACRSGGVIQNIGLQQNVSEIDMQRITYGEITLSGCLAYTEGDMRSAVDKIGRGMFGDLSWIETRSLVHGTDAFQELAAGIVASPKIVLLPDATKVVQAGSAIS